MNINYWQCPFSDCDSYYDGEEEIWLYGCSHPNASETYCGLANKWGGAKDECLLLDKNELDPSVQT